MSRSSSGTRTRDSAVRAGQRHGGRVSVAKVKLENKVQIQVTSSQCRTGQQRAHKWQNWPLNNAMKRAELLWGNTGVGIKAVLCGVFWLC